MRSATALARFFWERRAEVLTLTEEHVVLVLVSTGIAVLLGVPLGIAIARSPRLARPVLAAAGVCQTIPSLALFGFLIPVPFIGGIGPRAAVVALVLYALLPILGNTYTGLRQLDPAVIEAATGLGMTDGERLRLVELPLALPVILAGVRVAAVVSVGTATIAAAIGAGGLGTYIVRGLATVDSRLILAGAIPSALLALAADQILGVVERSPRPGRAGALVAALAATAVVVSAAAGGREPRTAVLVGSKAFTEQVVLGEIVAQRLEERGFRVERRLSLGGTTLCHEALKAGGLDVYVEYTGTALTDILKSPVDSDPQAVLARVRAGYASLGIEVLDPLGFNNTFALVMRRGEAERRRIRVISDLAPFAERLRVGLFGEFLEREDGLKGLLRAYDLHLGTRPREMDLGLLYEALAQDQVDLVVGSATDGLIAALDLLVLQDDRHYFPPYEAVPVASRAGLGAHPGLREALASLGGRVDEARMRRMNYAVDGEHRSPREVAHEFLARDGPHAAP